jgi:hypothetical protein
LTGFPWNRREKIEGDPGEGGRISSAVVMRNVDPAFSIRKWSK